MVRVPPYGRDGGSVITCTARQAFAIANPLNRADGDITPYRAARKHGTGLLIMTILAVDR